MYHRPFGSLVLAAFLMACGPDEAQPRPAHETPSRGATLAAVVPPSTAAAAPEAPSDESRFLGESDAAQRLALATEPIATVEKGRGGRSLAFKITLRDGTRGYFKPEQSFSAAHWWSEVAAYYLDRELGFGRVPALVGRRFRWAELRAAAGGDARVRELAIASDGTVRGAFVHWVEGGLEPLPLPRGWERWVRVRGATLETPYQRPADYRAILGGSRDPALEVLDPRRPRAADPPDPPERAGELSDLVVFDYLVQNVDRWGGGFTNVRTRGVGGPLVFLDNGAGFWPEARLPLMEARLEHLERFRRGTVAALERFDLRAFAKRLGTDPLAPVLEEALLEGLSARVRAVLAHVAAKRAEHGEAIFLD